MLYTMEISKERLKALYNNILDKYLEDAQNNKVVLISNVRKHMETLPINEKIKIYAEFVDINGQVNTYDLYLPFYHEKRHEDFIQNYVVSLIYNIINCIGAVECTFYFDLKNKFIIRLIEKCNEIFEVSEKRWKRKGYARCINMVERLFKAVNGYEKPFVFTYKDSSQFIRVKSRSNLEETPNKEGAINLQDLNNKLYIGLDIGGSSIKSILSDHGNITCKKMLSWRPFLFDSPAEMIEVIALVIRYLEAKNSCIYFSQDADITEIYKKLNELTSKNSSVEQLKQTVEEAEQLLGKERLIKVNAIGIGFPDVVIKNKIVSGECYKTRGMRENLLEKYDSEFAKLTNLNTRLQTYVTEENAVFIVNDAVIAAYTYAVEKYKNTHNFDDVFIYTLGTELGTGWIKEGGKIPELPLECYNMVIDLGTYDSRKYHPDDLRSINNFNTSIPGTLQKYVCQSAIYRIGIEYFQKHEKQCYDYLIEHEIIEEKHGFMTCCVNGKDNRDELFRFIIKMFTENNNIEKQNALKQIGVYMASLWLETEWILGVNMNTKVLAGGCIANRKFFDLVCEGAAEYYEKAKFEHINDLKMNDAKKPKADQKPKITSYATGGVYYACNQLANRKS